MSAKPAPEIQELADRIGEFMRYWGFSKIDGKVWALLFLSEPPLSAAELRTKLGVSKALLSLSLKQLSKYGVIRVAGTAKHGTQLYASVENLKEVVENVLRSRERQMLADITASARLVEKLKASSASTKRAKQLREMCESAEVLLDHFVLSGDCLGAIANFSGGPGSAIS